MARRELVKLVTNAAVKNAALPKASTTRTAKDSPMKVEVSSILSRTLWNEGEQFYRVKIISTWPVWFTQTE